VPHARGFREKSPGIPEGGIRVMPNAGPEIAAVQAPAAQKRVVVPEFGNPSAAPVGAYRVRYYAGGSEDGDSGNSQKHTMGAILRRSDFHPRKRPATRILQSGACFIFLGGDGAAPYTVLVPAILDFRFFACVATLQALDSF
jgi:hypothetical protein